MTGKHLTSKEVEAYTTRELEEAGRGAIELHLANCAVCRKRIQRAEQFESVMHDLPRAPAPRQLTERILATVDWRAAQEQTRRKRLPLIAFATLSSLLLALWFGIQMVTALYDTDALAFFSLFTSRPDIFSTYSSDAFFALLESLPISEFVLTTFAVVIAIVLAQQLIDTVPQRVAHSNRGRV